MGVESYGGRCGRVERGRSWCPVAGLRCPVAESGRRERRRSPLLYRWWEAV